MRCSGRTGKFFQLSIYQAFYRQVEMGLADAYDYAAGVMVENMMHAESKEGIGAFLEKRRPDWDKV